MSADELRQAAERLRSLASATLPTPWIVTHHAESGADVESMSCGCAHLDPRDDCASEAECPNWGIAVAAATLANGACMESDAAYIATMHPGVGLALADWLDEAAGLTDALEEDPFFVKPPGLLALRDKALVLARAINGGAS